MNLSLFLAGIFLSTFLFGRLLEKVRIPWVFSALFLGLVYSILNLPKEIISSEAFVFMAELGMYFLLFIMGFDLNIKKILKHGKFVLRLTSSIILAETLFGTIIIRFLFNADWLVAFLVASSFATVGEAVLLPILDEFKITKTKFGQTIFGVGGLSGIFELMVVVVVSILLGYSAGKSDFALAANFLTFVFLFLIPLLLVFFHKKIHHFKFKGVPSLFLFSLFIVFLFIGTGEYVECAPLGALFAGIALKTFLTKIQIDHLKPAIRILSYGFFVPIFFFWTGAEIDIAYLISAPLAIILILLTTKITKIFTSYILTKKKFGEKKALLLGVGLSAKFSTSIVIVTMLFSQNIISSDLYSTLIGAMIVSKFLIPVLFSFLLQKWDLKFEKIEK